MRASLGFLPDPFGGLLTYKRMLRVKTRVLPFLQTNGHGTREGKHRFMNVIHELNALQKKEAAVPLQLTPPQTALPKKYLYSIALPICLSKLYARNE